MDDAYAVLVVYALVGGGVAARVVYYDADGDEVGVDAAVVADGVDDRR